MGRPPSQNTRQTHQGGQQGASGGAPHPGEGGRVELTLPFPPSSNRYWRHNRGVTHLSSEARAYRDAVRLHGRTAGVEPLLGPVRVTYHFYRPRRAGDLCNREKQLADSLQGVAFENDSQIHEAHLFLHDDKANPRVEVLVEELR